MGMRSLSILLWVNLQVLDVRPLPGVGDLQRTGRRLDHRRVRELADFGLQIYNLLPRLAVVARQGQADRRAGDRRRVVDQENVAVLGLHDIDAGAGVRQLRLFGWSKRRAAVLRLG